MDDKLIDSWAQKLLDLGKRNKLINYRDIKQSYLEVVSPSVSDFFESIKTNTKFEIYDPKLGDKDFYEDSEDEDDPDVTVKKKKLLDRAEFIENFSTSLKSNQLLCFNKYTSPINAATRLNRLAKAAIDETGVNILYLAFGYVEWYESDNSKIKFIAPLLFVPISIDFKSKTKPIYIEILDDEVLINPAFDYKISNEFGINLPPYEGSAFLDYLEKVKKVIEPTNWNVASNCKVGTFSFQKISMYHDLINNKDSIVTNPNILKIACDYDCSEDEETSFEDDIKNINEIVDLHNVVDADSSQLKAIEMAKTGRSFVLQGPPGTGKSQTITNIISECIHDNKTVLFVSEKKAALDVVFNNLNKAGIGDCALELHSNKANKKDFVNELCRILHSKRTKSKSNLDKDIKLKAREAKLLNNYADALHAKIEQLEMSLYEVFQHCSKYYNNEDANVSIPNIKNKDIDFYNDACALIEEYAQYLAKLHDLLRDNPWENFVGEIHDYRGKNDLYELLIGSKNFINSLSELSNKIKLEQKVEANNFNGINDFYRLCNISKDATYLSPSQIKFLFNAEGNEYSKVKSIYNKLKEYSVDICKIEDELLDVFKNDVLNVDYIDDLNNLRTLYKSFASRLFKSDYKKLSLKWQELSKNVEKIPYIQLVSYIEKVDKYRKLVDKYKETEEKLGDILPVKNNFWHLNWDDVIREFDLFFDIYKNSSFFNKCENLNVIEFLSNAGDYLEEFKSLEHNYWDVFNQLINCFTDGDVLFKNYSFEEAADHINKCIWNKDEIVDLCRLRNTEAKLDEIELGGFVSFVKDEDIIPDYVLQLFKYVFYREWANYLISSNTTLNEFSRAQQDLLVNDFIKYDRKQLGISRAKIHDVLNRRRPSLGMSANGSSLQLLLKEGNKKSRLMPIRQLIEKIGDLVLDLKPCFLMSPLSVSTYLPSKSIKFDYVIFDEASQVFPQDSIGAIYRAKNLIVVGDSKQMPPSNFFNVNIVNEEDDYDYENDDISDYESLLDLCSAVLPSQRLEWHYRSRYEDLIAFSNYNFYDGGLLTFPSCKQKSKGYGVDFVYVDGVFNRKRHINKIEAQKIVELVKDNVSRFPDRSIGVVAFSKTQQDLIDLYLNRAIQEDDALKQYLAIETNEPLFVKNLETVQGDERDTIIFSIAYGYDESDRFYHNFGPLNKEGGERRLNVAVSRAKSNLIVVSSIHYTDIDVSKTSNKGPELLRNYLDFAENGENALKRQLHVDNAEQFDSYFEEEVFGFLKEKGFDVDSQVGCSGYKIDIGLKKPNSSDYVLAIECDGATYHSSLNARDRDRLRQEILENMGWKFYRIWSTDWFKNKKSEEYCLLKACKDALSQDDDSSEDKFYDDKIDKDSFEEEIDEFDFPVYQTADIPSRKPRAFQSFVKSVLEIEAPLSEKWFLKRICKLFNRQSANKFVREQFDALMFNCQFEGIVRKNGFLYLNPYPGINIVLRKPGAVRRDISDIAIEELAQGMWKIISENSKVTKDGLFNKLAKILGYTSVRGSSRARFDEALNSLGSMIENDGDFLSLRKKVY